MNRESKILIGILALVVGGMIGLFALANGNSEPKLDLAKDSKLVRDDSHKLGTGDKVTIVEFGDYQCPACASAEPLVKRITEEYKDQITFVFRNYPLETLHPNAMAAAQAAEAAAAQGKFWEYHDLLYQNQNEWKSLTSMQALDKFTSYANDLNIDANQLRQAIVDKKYLNQIEQDRADGTAQDITGTPTFFFNGEKLQGTPSYDELKAKIDAALQA